ALTGEQLVRDLAIELRRPQAEDVVPEQVLGDHRRVRLELADPPPVGMLELEQPCRPPLEREVEPALDPLGRDRHAGTFVPLCTSARAAATPLATALSIVTGQPVSSQAPARATPSRTGPGRGRFTPGRSAIVACGSRLTRDQRSSASPSRPVSSRAISSTISRPRSAPSSGAPLETTGRYWPRSGSCPVKRPRSNTQCAALPRSAASSCPRIRRSKRRWTLTIGECSYAPSSGGVASTTRSASSASGSSTRAPVSTVAPAASSA